MSLVKNSKTKCPVCKKALPIGSAYKPFCSNRCQTIDLGNWLSDFYRIPLSSDNIDPNDLEEALEQAQDNDGRAKSNRHD